MPNKNFESLDEVIAEQNRLMNGKIPEKTKEEWEELDRLMSEVISKDKEKKAKVIQTA